MSRTTPMSDVAHRSRLLAVSVAVVLSSIPLARPAHAADQPVPANLATGATASQSTTLGGGTGPELAIDQLVSGFAAQGHMARTQAGNEEYWQVDLGSDRAISQIKLWEGIDSTSTNDLTDFSVFVSSSSMNSPSLTTTRNQPGVTEVVHLGGVDQQVVFDIGRSARYVRVQRHGSGILSLAEVEILGSGEFAEIDPDPLPTWGATGIEGSITVDIDAEIFAIEQIGRTLFVGGRFSKPVQRRNGTTMDQPYLMALDAQTGAILEWFRPQLTGAVLALEAAPDGSRLFVGGEFYSVDDHAATSGLAALDPRTGHVDPSWTTSIDRRFAPGPPTVKNLEIAGGHLYAIGSFHGVRDRSGVRRSSDNVARFDLGTGDHDSGWRPRVSGGSGYGIAVDPGRGRAYLAGTFDQVDGDTSLFSFAAVDLVTGDPIPGQPRYPINSGTHLETFDVVVHDDLIFVGGSQHILTAMDADSTGSFYSIVNRIYTNGGGGDVQDIEVVGDRVYASCHCRANVWDEDHTGRIFEGGVRGVFAVDAATGRFVDTFPTQFVDWTLSAGPWALHGGADACLWVGGDINPVSGGPYPVSLGRLCPENGPAATGLGAPSPRPPDTTAPTTPGRPTTSLTGDDVILAWSGSTDARGVASYGVRRDGAIVGKTRETTLRLFDEPPGRHSYTVVGLDPAGNQSAPSAARDATVPDDVGAFRSFIDANLDSWLAGTEFGPFVFREDLEGATARDSSNNDPLPYPGGRFYGLYSPGGMPVDDGGIVARIGGDVDPGVTYDDQAAGFEASIVLAEPAPLSIEFDYRLTTGRTMNGVSAAVWVDGQPRNPGGSGYLETRGSSYAGGWEHAEFELGTLGAGTHQVVIGLRIDEQWRNILARFATLAVDDVVIADARPGVELVSPAAGSEVTGTQQLVVAATDHLTAVTNLDVDISVDAGSSWLPATYASGRFSRDVDTTALPDGDLDVQVRVSDTDGHQVTVMSTIVVDNRRSVGELAATEGAGVVWRLDEMSSTIAADLIGGTDGTYVGNPQRGIPSPVQDSGRAVRFDGVDDGIRLPASDLIDGAVSDASSVELWFSADNVDRRGVLYEQGGRARGMSVYVDGGRLYAGAWNTAADAALDVPWTAGPAFLSVPVTTGGLHHVVLVHDAPRGVVTAYLDGRSIGSVRGVGRLFPDRGLAAIGYARGGTRFHDGPGSGQGWFYDGLLDEVVRYPVAVDQALVTRHNEAGR